MSKNNGGPAFARPKSPKGEYTDSEVPAAQTGMSLRDYFAAKALPAVMSGEMLHAASEIAKNRGMRPEQGIAKAAYEMADAMLAARSLP